MAAARRSTRTSPRLYAQHLSDKHESSRSRLCLSASDRPSRTVLRSAARGRRWRSPRQSLRGRPPASRSPQLPPSAICSALRRRGSHPWPPLVPCGTRLAEENTVSRRAISQNGAGSTRLTRSGRPPASTTWTRGLSKTTGTLSRPLYRPDLWWRDGVGSFSRCSQSRGLAPSDGAGGARGNLHGLYEPVYSVSLVLEDAGDAGGLDMSTTPLLHFPNESANSPIR